MTCIVGLKEAGKVYIGGDTLGVGGYSKVLRNDGKVFKKNNMIFGFTSSYRMGQILRYTFAPPPRHEELDDMTYLVAHFIPALIESYKSGGYLMKQNEAAKGGTFLLGYRAELYNIQDDFQVGIASLGYDACGCGEDLAKGAMYVAKELNITSSEKVTKALEAASTHSAGVGGRFEIIEL